MKTRVAVLGTLAEFHKEPIPYNLAALLELVAGLGPDLLCLDLTPEQWLQKDFEGLPPEYREALLPLADQTDIVVVPIAGQSPPHEPTAQGVAGMLMRMSRSCLAFLQRTAPGPAAVNQGLRHHLANLLYWLNARLAGLEVRVDWKRHTDHLIRSVEEVARNDPGRRVLVVVNVRHCHLIRYALREVPDIEVVRHQQL